MTTVTTNQGIVIPVPGDNNNVPLHISGMLSGGVTPSAGLENRLVQRYASVADRTARNPTPNEGELSYLIDLNRYDTYTGAAWISLTKGYVIDQTRTVNSAGFTNTEVVLDYVTFTAVAGQLYKFSYFGNLQTAVVNDTGRWMFRWQPGATLTTAGTLEYSNVVNFPVAGSNGKQFTVASKVIGGIPSGTVSIGCTAIRDTGSGLWTSAASGNQRVYMIVEIV